MNIESIIINLLKKQTKLKEITLENPPDPKLGDYAFPCFQLSKTSKKSPVEIAKSLESIKLPKEIEKVKAIGPYLNFYINPNRLAESVIKQILKEKNKYGAKKNKEKIIVEYVSPNTNKSLHLGHVRNGLLGTALSNILQSQGYNVIKASLNNDRGTGMSEAMLGYLMYHKGENPKTKPDHFVAQCYVDYKQSETEETKAKVQKLTLDWENNNKEVRELWSKLTKWVYQGYKETYKNLGIEFDKEYYESKIYTKGKEIVHQGLKKGIFKKKDGVIIAKLEKYNLPDKILIKSDGTSLYMTQDLYLAKLKEQDFKIDRSIYVVASEQDLHFKQLFQILELLDFKVSKKCYHLSYGLVNLHSGRMKSREGNVIDADDIIEEVTSLAREELKKREEKDIEKKARIIGLAALKFFMLKFDNATSFVYDPQQSLSFEGETGPYCQYTYARIKSILRKCKTKVPVKITDLTTGEEKNIIMLLYKYPKVLEYSAENYKPHLLSRFILDLCQAFNEFYHQHQILKAEKDLKVSRLNLIIATSIIIENSLKLLGIETLESM
ncbi:arginine--tRNA ligase [Candidatus Woesearchaeota archaeon]|nr:arginine--tRNA ligase [Candidatus Woesearchaeota archaeon]